MMSTIAPRVTRTSFVSAAGGNWKCMPRTAAALPRLNATLACAIHGLEPVLLELVLAERAREEAALVLTALEVDHERAGEVGLGEDHARRLAGDRRPSPRHPNGFATTTSAGEPVRRDEDGRSGGSPRRRRLPFARTTMRILVTGHHGYIGSVLAPFLASGGARRRRARRIPLPRLRLRAAADAAPLPARAVDVRDVHARGPRRLRRRRPPRGALERPARRARFPADTTRSTSGLGRGRPSAAKRAASRRFVFASSCSV